MTNGVGSDTTPPAGDHDDGDGDEPRPGLLTHILRARDQPRSPWLMIVAVVLFLVFTVVAFRHLPHIDKPLRWELLLVAGLVVVPVITVLNALDKSYIMAAGSRTALVVGTPRDWKMTLTYKF